MLDKTSSVHASAKTDLCEERDKVTQEAGGRQDRFSRIWRRAGYSLSQILLKKLKEYRWEDLGHYNLPMDDSFLVNKDQSFNDLSEPFLNDLKKKKV